MSVDLPAGPTVAPALQLGAWIFRPSELLVRCWRRYGDTFTLRFPRFAPMVVVSDPASIEQVFADDSDSFSSASANILLKPTLGTNSLLLLDGPRHRAERKIMMPPFHRARIDAHGDIIREATRQVIEGTGREHSWLQRGSFPIHPEMKRITMDVILRAVLGLGHGPTYERLPSVLDRLFSIGNHPVFQATLDATGDVRARAWQEHTRFSPWSIFRDARDALDEVMLSEIRRRRVGTEARADVLSLLLAARDEQGQPLSDRVLRDEMLTLLVAGHKTTATALTWTLYEIASDQRLWLRLQEEARAGEYALLEATIKETLRLHPTIPLVLRRLLAPRRVGGWDLPPGVLVAPAMFLSHRRPEAWEDPQSFRPERFTKQPSPLSYFPFGGGPRRCLGAAFALFEMRLVLSEILQRVRLEVPRHYVAKTVRRGITFTLRDGLPVRVFDIARPARPRAQQSSGTRTEPSP